MLGILHVCWITNPFVYSVAPILLWAGSSNLDKTQRAFFYVQKPHPTLNLRKACELTPITLSLS